VPRKALEAVKNRKQVAPKALEAEALPVPVAPKMRKNQPKAAEADSPACGLHVRNQFKPISLPSSFC
jgi:hypothetical protein